MILATTAIPKNSTSIFFLNSNWAFYSMLWFAKFEFLCCDKVSQLCGVDSNFCHLLFSFIACYLHVKHFTSAIVHSYLLHKYPKYISQYAHCMLGIKVNWRWHIEIKQHPFFYFKVLKILHLFNPILHRSGILHAPLTVFFK